ncbi:MAG: PASTA domain-containing protein [Rikenellaceae bacterium]
MGKEKNILDKVREFITNNFLARNIILAISLIVIVLTILYLSLGALTRHGQRYTLPDFSGMSLTQAAELAKEIEIDFEISDSLFVPSRPKGSIIEQYPKAGNFVKKGRRVFLTTNSFSPKMVPIPYVAGFSLRQAKNKIVGAGFVIEKIIYKNDIATFNVLEQSYDGKKISSANQNVIAPSGSGITLTVGLNPVEPEILIPNLAGLRIEEAKNRLWEAGFNVGTIELDSDIDEDNENSARVYSQSPLAARKAMHGRSISFNASASSTKVSKAIGDISKDIQKYEIEQRKKDSTINDVEINASELEDMIELMNSEIQ